MAKLRGKGLALFPDASIQKQGLYIPVAIILATWGLLPAERNFNCTADITIYHRFSSRHSKQKLKSTDLFRRDLLE